MTGTEGAGQDRIRVAAIQAASVFLDRAASTDKACSLISEAGRHGAELIVFPEGFVPAHPGWFHFHPASHPIAAQLALDLFDNSVEVGGPEVARVGEAARQAGAQVVLGVCERIAGTDGTMYNTQLFFGPDGRLAGKHQKLTPTSGERLVHAAGFGDTFGALPSAAGPISGLICGENSNPAAILALDAEHVRVHAMSWPNFVAPTAPPLPGRVQIASLAFAAMARCYVVSAAGVIDEAMIRRISAPAEYLDFLHDPGVTGGSVIVSPRGDTLAGPLGPGEEIIYADLDLKAPSRAKLSQDYAGHCNRPDVFQLRVDKRGRRLVDHLDIVEVPVLGADHAGTQDP